MNTKYIVRNIAVLSLIFVCCVSCTKPTALTNKEVLFDVKMRAIRMKQTLLDSNLDPKQYVGWNKDQSIFKEITKSRWVKSEMDGKRAELMMFRFLLIPNAPWMTWHFSGGSFYSAAREGARLDKFGEWGWHKLSIAGQQHKYMMWKTVDTGGKRIYVDWPKIYECGDDSIGIQIGEIGFRDLILVRDTVKVIMTKGMSPHAVWEGDVCDTTYREFTEGRGTPVAKLAYHPLKLEDGTETVILMSRNLNGNATWVGARDGKVIRNNDK